MDQSQCQTLNTYTMFSAQRKTVVSLLCHFITLWKPLGGKCKKLPRHWGHIWHHVKTYREVRAAKGLSVQTVWDDTQTHTDIDTGPCICVPPCCLTPVNVLMRSAVWDSYCGLSLCSEVAKEARLSLSDSHDSTHPPGVKGDFNMVRKKQRRKGTWEEN